MQNQPLADRLRPKDLDDMVGQPHLIGNRGILRRLLDAGRFTNMIFSGPPGTGKTTAANIIAARSGMPLYKLNATTASLSDVKEIAASTSNVFGAGGILLYLDEIQYFNRKQQQSLLEYMEDGRITLIASTTENPYATIYSALISRSSVFSFRPVTAEECLPAMQRGLALLNRENGKEKTAANEVLIAIAARAGGDVRCALGILENAYHVADTELDAACIDDLAPAIGGAYDLSGDVHYDLLSGLQKSIRGSDPDAAVFYLARILAGGDLLSACRRLQVIASEDVGLAYPLAAVVTRACVESAKDLGLPEASIPLSHAAVLLATAPKSNSAHIAYEAAMQDVQAGMGVVPPPHLRAPLYKGYRYPHDYEYQYVKQQYLPNDLRDKHYYTFGQNKTEQAARAYYEMIRTAGGKKKKEE
ncbi:MAG: replication-associated recombination protein A [Clostridia bacterium]|nr:replication-associated recombination protein A [Clostridia bacterium]